MKKVFTKIGLWIGLLTVIMLLPVKAGAAQPAENEGQMEESIVWKEISDQAGLLGMESDPEGDYILTDDIDMTDVDWFPFSFRGKLNGNGFSVLNLTVVDAGEEIRETYDGNMKVYDTYFGGLFDTLEGGWVSDLHLVNLRVKVETDHPCFLGGIAGYMENSSIENCSVQGILELRAHDRMFGVGGMIGYGCGSILDTTADVTLVCIDTDAATRDEQFMGGVCAAGYPDIKGCSVQIAGYDSDHGYVHDGGLVGMYMFYPKGTKYRGTITDNRVTGKITFFEDNKNRRAYCNGFIGEIMNWDFENGRNKDDFVRDEVFQYGTDLLPHSCDAPVMREEVTAPGCEFGFTAYVCETCGYRETDHYTLKNHDYDWTVLREATEEAEGERQGVCRDCGAQTVEEIPKVIPEPTETESGGDLAELGQVTPDGTEGWNNVGAGEEGTSQNTAPAAEGKKIWTVPEIGRGATLGIAILVAIAALCIVWGIRRQQKR